MSQQHISFEQAQKLYRQRYFREAVQALSLLLQADSQNPNYWLYLGLSYRYLRQHKDAENAFNELIILQPDSPWNYFYRGRAKFGQGQYQDAIEDFNIAEELEAAGDEFYGPGALYELFMFRAECYEALELYQNAIYDYHQYSSYSGKRYVYEREKERLQNLLDKQK